MDGHFQVRVHDKAGNSVVTVAGEVDVSTAPTLRARLDGLAPGRRTVVDLSDVTFIDSTGLGVLVAARRRAQQGAPPGEIRLVVTRPQVAKVFEVTGLAEVFVVHASLDEALAP